MIELRSDLGGGKTTFVGGLAKGAGSATRVSSPSFTLSRVYSTKNFDIHHFDFHRLDDAGILADQLAEAVGDQRNVVIVEWADIVGDVLPGARLRVEFYPAITSPDERRIVFKCPDFMRDAIASLESDWQESRP